jgi:hypothetical protein
MSDDSFVRATLRVLKPDAMAGRAIFASGAGFGIAERSRSASISA